AARLARLVRRGDTRAREAELRRFLEPLLAALHGPHFAREPDLAEDDGPLRERTIAQARNDREQHCEIRARLGDAHAADGAHEDVLVEAGDAGMAVKDRD